MKRWFHCILLATLIAVMPLDLAFAVYGPRCESGSIKELEASIEDHNESIYRLDSKFEKIWYLQGNVPEEIRKKINLGQVKEFLNQLKPRKTAVIFHAKAGHALCTWLVDSDGAVIAEVQRDKDSRYQLTAFNSGYWQKLGMRGARSPRMAREAQPSGDDFSKPQPTMDQWDSLLRPISNLLFPKRIVTEILSHRIDTLIVVPVLITVEQSPESFPYPEDMSPRARNRFIFALSTLPFGALPIHDDKRLIDLVSVIVAPGFTIFAQEPVPARHLGRESLVVGNPATEFESLPGAQLEATEIANALGVQAVLAQHATKERVLSMLDQHPDDIDLVHLAVHGIADSENPLDMSFLAFADGHLTAREIGQLRLNGRPLLAGRPLVVMSACETALGKDFSAGTIGLARAWQWAGAGQVAMTLWTVNDAATQKLMTEFIGFIVRGEAADKALQKAMNQIRRDDPNPALWASFQLFGSVELLR